MSHTAHEASGGGSLDRDAGPALTVTVGAGVHARHASSLLVAVEDYVPGGASFRPGSNLATPLTLDLRETGNTGTPVSDTFFGADGPGFADLIDIINPLQQLPVVGLLYRTITKDTIAPAAQLAGSTLYGGMAGLFTAVGTAFLKEAAGEDLPRSLKTMLAAADDQRTSRPADAAAASQSRRANTRELRHLL